MAREITFTAHLWERGREKGVCIPKRGKKEQYVFPDLNETAARKGGE